MSAETLKGLAEFFKSAHEILPTRSYFSMGGDPFGEKNWDINADGRVTSSFTYNQFVALLDDIRFPRSKPGTANRVFNDNPGQDDWNLDSSGVRFFHFYGARRRMDTIGKLTAVSKPLCDTSGSSCKPTSEFAKTYVLGDGTVPLLSAERTSANTNLNAPSATLKRFFRGNGENLDVEYLALTQNFEVFAALLSALSAGPQSQVLGPAPELRTLRRTHHTTSNVNRSLPVNQELPVEPAYYVMVTGVDQIIVTDAAGNSNEPIPDSPFGARLPDVTYDLGLNSVSVVTPIDQTYALTFQSRGEPIAL